MKKQLLISSIASSAAVLVLSTSSALAWQPKGAIQKQVQNTTSDSEVVDANDTSSALSVKPGDVLEYSFTVNNSGETSDDNQNDMVNTVLTDNLPNGVELVDDPTNRNVEFKLDTIAAQNSVTKTVTVKVTSTKDGEIIDNKACFVGNSSNNDSHQSGCDHALIKVSNPPVLVTPQVKGVTTLVNTGPASILPIAFIISVIGYVGANIFQRKRVSKTTQ